MSGQAEISSLLKTHKVLRGTNKTTKEEYYSIRVNKPEDFIYDTSDIVIQYFPSTGMKNVVCDEITEDIKTNISKFSYLEINKFIEFLEANLEIFMMGKSPVLKTDEEPLDKACKPGELPAAFKFPVHNHVTTNLKCDLSKSNILLLCCIQPYLIVRCDKCKEIASLMGNSICKKCSEEIGFTYVPVIYDEFLGFLKMKRCELIGFNPMKYQFNCETCSKNYESDEIGVGVVYASKCSGCYKEMRLKVNRIDLYKKQDVKLKEGTELPDKGTCKHYKKSFRWFRFSCCSSVYPCDICHDEKAGHKSKEALKMICGLCSKEQSVKPECDCGMTLKRKTSQFWEGGKGNRNKATMNKNDKKKYS